MLESADFSDAVTPNVGLYTPPMCCWQALYEHYFDEVDSRVVKPIDRSLWLADTSATNL